MVPEQPLTFGALLRRYREAAGLSQEDLAERAGLTASAIGALERGERRRPYPDTMRRLAQALDLDEGRRATLMAAVPRRGKDVPAAISRPSVGGDTVANRSPITERTTPFVGRRDELEILQTALTNAFGGGGGIVMLTGEAGIGKTRLAREFASDAASQGTAVLWGNCFEDWQPPYGPWVQAITIFVRSRPAEAARHELGAWASPLVQLVPVVRAIVPDAPVPSPLSPDEERVRLYDAIIGFLLAVSGEQPVLLVLDDLHWADPDSLRLLRHLARFVETARVLVVGAYRDPEISVKDDHPLLDTLSFLRRESDYERILIRGFSREEVAEYLTRSAGQTIPQGLVRVIQEETNGNPFYAREVFRHLTEEVKVLQHDERWNTDLSLRALGIPEGVRQVVGRRIARLSSGTGALLRLAAGFSAGFGFDVLQVLGELSEPMLLSSIDEALRAGLIRVSSLTPPRYEFAHAIVRDTLYDGLNPDRRARLHRRIAVVLEQMHAGRWEDAAEVAAQYHASAALPGAGNGIIHALEAAAQAKAAYAHGQAVRFLRMARDLADKSPAAERAEILRQLAVAEAEAVRLEEARQSVEDALEAMNAAGVELRARAEFLVVVARALKDGGADATVWGPLVERGLALVGGARDLLWARLALLRDHFEVIQSGPVGAARWLGSDPEAVAVARAAGDEEDYARTLEPLDLRTREETDAVLRLARTWSRPLAIMRALDVAGRDLIYRHGAFHEARMVYEELLAVSERFGSIPGQGEALTHIATSQIYTGDLVLGQETWQRAQEVIAKLGAGHRLRAGMVTARAVVLAYFLEGDWPSLAEAATNYATAAAATQSPVGLVAAAIAALAERRAGNVAKARALLQHVTSALEQVPPTMYAHSVAVVVAATAAWDLEAAEHAATYRRLALDLLRTRAGDTGFGPFEMHMARMSALLGDATEAQDYFERARRKLDAHGYTHMRAILDYDQARTLIQTGVTNHARTVTLLDAALGAFHSHGMLGWAARAVEWKETLANQGHPTI